MQLQPAQIEVFAAGLYQLAASDGVCEQELTIIREFVEEAGAPDLVARLPELSFDPATAYQTLGSTWLRKLFLQSAVMVIRADGEVSDAERETLGWMAMAFGVPGGYDGVVAALEGVAI
jgi:hypothetical protein